MSGSEEHAAKVAEKITNSMLLFAELAIFATTLDGKKEKRKSK